MQKRHKLLNGSVRIVCYNKSARGVRGGGVLVLRSRAIFSLEITELIILICNGINVLEGNNMPPAKTNLAAGTRSPFRVPLKKKKMKALNTLGREGREEEGCE